MPQYSTWENEYKQSQLVTKRDKPQNDVLRFLKFLKKEEGVELERLTVLDLGCGTGRNANYIAQLGNTVVGFEIASTALQIAKTRSAEMGVDVEYQLQDMGTKYACANERFDLVIDITSSNSLNEKERSVYLSEVHRVLKKGGYFFVKALCKDADKNAKALLKKNPGAETDTYIIEEMNLTERVFSQQDFIDLYSPYFSITTLTKKTSYTQFNGQSYKRNFWLAYMKKI